MTMKTQYRKTVLKVLQGLNDQLCYFLFSSHEFSIGLDDYSPNAQGLFTTDLYSQNPYAPSIHVRVSNLPHFIDQITASTFGTYVSATYEVIAHYLMDASLLLADINAPQFKQISGNGVGPEEKLQKEITKAGYSPLNIADVATLTYYRLRRNHIIHRRSAIKPKFLKFISDNCNMLNHHWIGSVEKQDFSTHDIFAFGERETIDALKLLKIVFERVDSHVASILDVETVVDRLAKTEFAGTPQKINSDIVQNRVGILRNRAKIIHGFTPTQSVLEAAARKYGIK